MKEQAVFNTNGRFHFNKNKTCLYNCILPCDKI